MPAACRIPANEASGGLGRCEVVGGNHRRLRRVLVVVRRVLHFDLGEVEFHGLNRAIPAGINRIAGDQRVRQRVFDVGVAGVAVVTRWIFACLPVRPAQAS